MARGRWRPNDESLAKEAYLVLIRKEKPSRTFSKATLLATLIKPGVYLDFLKICLEWDNTKRSDEFRKGLLLTIQAIGPSTISKATGISRVTLYRMLAKDGNPRLSTLTSLFRHLGLRLWVVDNEFIARSHRVSRPKNEGRLIVEKMKAKAL